MEDLDTMRMNVLVEFIAVQNLLRRRKEANNILKNKELVLALGLVALWPEDPDALQLCLGDRLMNLRI